MAWFEALLEEQDVDIMAWAIGNRPLPPVRYDGAMMRPPPGRSIISSYPEMSDDRPADAS